MVSKDKLDEFAKQASDAMSAQLNILASRTKADPDTDQSLRHQLILESRSKRPKVGVPVILIVGKRYWLSKETRQLSRERYSGEELTLYTNTNRPDMMICFEAVKREFYLPNFTVGFLFFETFDIADVTIVGHYWGNIVSDKNQYSKKDAKRNVYVDLRVSNVVRQTESAWFSKRTKLGRYEEFDKLFFPEKYKESKE